MSNANQAYESLLDQRVREAFAAGRAAERDRIVKALEADYRANVADGADGIYTDGLHDAWRLTERQSKRDDLIERGDTDE